MMTTPAVAVLTWRGEEMTRQCLVSLRPRDGWTMPIVVIDNGSGTGEGDRLAAEFGVACVALAENGGVPAGYNAAIRWAREHGATHVLLANNDLTFSQPDLLGALMDHATDDVAAVGPVILSRDGAIASAGGRLLRWFGHVERTRRPWASQPYDVDALDGSCMLVSIDAACRIGGFAPGYFLYWEETDWCARARRAGLRLVVDPGATVTHVGLASGDVRQTRRYALRNSLLFVRRNLDGAERVTATLAWLIGKLPLFLVRRLFERANPSTVLADARWAVGWHLRRANSRAWKRPADGPDLCA